MSRRARVEGGDAVFSSGEIDRGGRVLVFVSGRGRLHRRTEGKYLEVGFDVRDDEGVISHGGEALQRDAEQRDKRERCLR